MNVVITFDVVYWLAIKCFCSLLRISELTIRRTEKSEISTKSWTFVSTKCIYLGHFGPIFTRFFADQRALYIDAINIGQYWHQNIGYRPILKIAIGYWNTIVMLTVNNSCSCTNYSVITQKIEENWHNIFKFHMGQYSAEYSVRFGLDVQLFGFGRIVKSAFRYITTINQWCHHRDVTAVFHENTQY